MANETKAFRAEALNAFFIAGVTIIKVYLVLENGIVMEGEGFGFNGEATGEVVFATGMQGYIETLTDQSYYGQIILQTFPLIGNYGVIPEDFEHQKISAKGYIVKHHCQLPSNFRSIGNLDDLLTKQGTVGLYGVDTRALTKIIRAGGALNGKITPIPPNEETFEEIKAYKVKNAVAAVSTRKCIKTGEGPRRVALLDFGAKHGIVRELEKRGCIVWRFPHDTPAGEIKNIQPNGIMLSNGPGDPSEAANTHIVHTLYELVQTGIPIFGICLGHQLLALAKGYKTKKMKFGHRGANQPVKEISTGRIYITSQNHGYTVDTDDCAYINLNDGTCEGLDYGDSFSVQFHPEACGGPLDTMFLFDSFIERMDANAPG